MIVLAADTCCGQCSISILKDGALSAKIVELERNKQAELLVILAERALRHAEIEYKDIDLWAITKGPGGFTGIRSGLAFLNAARMIMKKPCIGITTLDALAMQLSSSISDTEFFITISAGRGRYYCQLFNQALVPIDDIKLKTIEDLQILQRPIYGHYQNDITIDTDIVAMIALMRFSAMNGKNHEIIKAIYTK